MKVFVGLSGGVDSAVSAALLQKTGYDITGVFIKVWQPDWVECNWQEERRDAMRVAAHLGISFVTLDCEDEYKRGVIDYMIAEYEIGRTPNPDVMCNKTVKFGAFYDFAMGRGADFVATGHYARSVGGKLLAGVDHNKDQSYFLWTVKQEQLSHLLFPVGSMTKPDVRKLAEKFGLPNAEKKDSQGLCFIGKVDLKDFLSHYVKTEKGNVLNEDGEVIGTHPGALFFTIGERHGFTISKKTPTDAPFFVTDKDMEQNTITVSNRDASQSLPSATKIVRLQNVNWISGEVPTIGHPLLARSRYRQKLQNLRIISSGITETICEFDKPQDTLTSGQSLVIYNGEECLGGGVIE
jgi:tRNA-specific 2-thiouridylase